MVYSVAGLVMLGSRGPPFDHHSSWSPGAFGLPSCAGASDETTGESGRLLGTPMWTQDAPFATLRIGENHSIGRDWVIGWRSPIQPGRNGGKGDTVPGGKRRNVATGVDSKLAKYAGGLMLDRLGTLEQAIGDFAFGHPVREIRQNFTFSWRQAESLHELRFGGRRDLTVGRNLVARSRRWIWL